MERPSGGRPVPCFAVCNRGGGKSGVQGVVENPQSKTSRKGVMGKGYHARGPAPIRTGVGKPANQRLDPFFLSLPWTPGDPDQRAGPNGSRGAVSRSSRPRSLPAPPAPASKRPSMPACWLAKLPVGQVIDVTPGICYPRKHLTRTQARKPDWGD